MTDPTPLSIPKPPDNADINEMHKHMLDMYTFVSEAMTNGLQHPTFSTTQLDQMTRLSQFGKSFIDQTDGKMKYATVDAGNLVIKTIVTA